MIRARAIRKFRAKPPMRRWRERRRQRRHARAHYQDHTQNTYVRKPHCPNHVGVRRPRSRRRCRRVHDSLGTDRQETTGKVPASPLCTSLPESRWMVRLTRSDRSTPRDRSLQQRPTPVNETIPNMATSMPDTSESKDQASPSTWQKVGGPWSPGRPRQCGGTLSS